MCDYWDCEVTNDKQPMLHELIHKQWNMLNAENYDIWSCMHLYVKWKLVKKKTWDITKWDMVWSNKYVPSCEMKCDKKCELICGINQEETQWTIRKYKEIQKYHLIWFEMISYSVHIFHQQLPPNKTTTIKNKKHFPPFPPPEKNEKKNTSPPFPFGPKLQGSMLQLHRPNLSTAIRSSGENHLKWWFLTPTGGRWDSGVGVEFVWRTVTLWMFQLHVF